MKLNEGNLKFDFSSCLSASRFDDDETKAFGLKAVDFMVETEDSLYFMEVKDYQNPKSHNRMKDLEMLKAAQKDGKHVFCIEMGSKIKDSLLRQYAEGIIPEKKVKYLLLINLDALGANERGRLKAKISGHIPTGLNSIRFAAFTELSFDLVNAKQLKDYGIDCTPMV